MARGRKTKERTAKLWKAAPVAEAAAEMVEVTHTHLMASKLVCVFTAAQLKMFGRVTGIKSDVVGGKAAALAQGLPASQIPEEREAQFFLISVNASWWDHAKPEQRSERLDNALSRCGINDKGGLMLWPPDVITFRGVIQRHGLPTHDLKELAKVIQGALPGLDAEEQEIAAAIAQADRDVEVARAGLRSVMSEAEAAALVAEGETTGEELCPISGFPERIFTGMREEASALADEQAALDAEPCRTLTDEEQLRRLDEEAAQAETNRKGRRRPRGLSAEGEAALAGAA